MLGPLIVCLVSMVIGEPRQELNIRWVYVEDHLTWTPPPKDPELPKYETASARLAVFYPSGEFGEGWFTVGRYPSKSSIFIIPGEGFAILKGKWTRNSDGSIAVESRVVYQDKVLHVGEDATPRQVAEHWLLQGNCPGRLGAVLQSPRGKYVPLQGLANLKTFANLMKSMPRSAESGS